VAEVVAANLKGEFGPYKINLSAYDYVAIALTISHTAVPLKIMLRYGHCDDREMKEINYWFPCSKASAKCREAAASLC